MGGAYRDQSHKEEAFDQEAPKAFLSDAIDARMVKKRGILVHQFIRAIILWLILEDVKHELT